MRRFVLTTALVAFALVGAATKASAHTISIGYANAGPGAVSFWFGTYHSPAEAPTFEGSFNLLGILGTAFPSTTVPFTTIATSTPTGLIDGTTNFYANPTGGSGPYPGGPGLFATNNIGLPVLTWQGVTFTGLAAGTYQFSYIPIANPTVKWAPWSASIQTGQVTLTGAIVQPPPTSVPEPASLSLLGFGIVSFLAYRRRARARR